MIKYYLTLLALFIIPTDIYAVDDDNGKDTKVSEYQAEIRRMKSDAEEIHELFRVFDLDIVNEEYEKLTGEVQQIENILREVDSSGEVLLKNEFFDLFEETLKSYNNLITLYDFYTQLENKKENWSNEYFNLWEQTYAYKSRIEKLYVSEEKVNVHYGGMKDTKVTKVRKKQIYESCSAIYEQKMSALKRLNDCDHFGRILILENLIPVLRKCSKLAIVDGTKDLEKELKRTEDPEAKAVLITSFEIEE